jgi:hypothetical protein
METLSVGSVESAEPVDWDLISKTVNPILSSRGILLILLLLLFLTLLGLWLLGFWKGNSILDGKILPTGFPTYFIRNLVSTFSLISLAVGTLLIARNLPIFEASMSVFLFFVICACFLTSELLFNHFIDGTGAGLATSLAGTAILFLLVLSWSSTTWSKLLLLLPLLWLIYLSLSFLAFGKKNASS